MREALAPIARRLPQGRFGRSVAVLAGGTAIGQAVTVAVSPLLTRLYSPAEFGVFAAFSAVLAVLVVASTLGYELALPLPEDEATAETLFRLCWRLTLAAGAMTALGVWALGDVWAARLGASGVAMWLLPVGVVAVGAYKTLSYWGLRRKAYGTLARTRLGQSASQAVIQLTLGLAHFGPLGLILGGLAGQAGGSATLLRLVPRGRRGEPDRPALGRIAWRFRKFPLFSFPATLVNTANLQLPVLALAALYAPQTLGFFALGQRVVSVSMELVGEAVHKAFYGEAASSARTGDVAAVRGLFWSVTGRMAVWGAPAIALLALVSPWICEQVFGEPWREAGVYLQLLAPMFFAKLVATPTDVLPILERQELTLVRELGRVGLWAIALGGVVALGATPIQAVAAFGVAGFGGYALYFAVSCWALHVPRRAA